MLTADSFQIHPTITRQPEKVHSQTIEPQPEPAKPTSEETGKNILTMTHAEFRDFLLGVQAAFNGFPDLWTRFLDLALKFMQAHSSHPPSPGPAPNPA